MSQDDLSQLENYGWHGWYFATARFEHIISGISRTACDSSMKFGMHTHLNEWYLYIYLSLHIYLYLKTKNLSTLCNKGYKVKKTVFLHLWPINQKIFGPVLSNLVSKCSLSILMNLKCGMDSTNRRAAAGHCCRITDSSGTLLLVM